MGTSELHGRLSAVLCLHSASRWHALASAERAFTSTVRAVTKPWCSRAPFLGTPALATLTAFTLPCCHTAACQIVTGKCLAPPQSCSSARGGLAIEQHASTRRSAPPRPCICTSGRNSIASGTQRFLAKALEWCYGSKVRGWAASHRRPFVGAHA